MGRLSERLAKLERWLQGKEAGEVARAQVADVDEKKVREEWDRLTRDEKQEATGRVEQAIQRRIRQEEALQQRAAQYTNDQQRAALEAEYARQQSYQQSYTRTPDQALAEVLASRDEAQQRINSLTDQIYNQAQTIAELRGELEKTRERFAISERELGAARQANDLAMGMVSKSSDELGALRRERGVPDLAMEADLTAKRQRAMRKLDDNLYQDGPVPLIEEVNEETLAWMLELAGRNTPMAGTEVNEREVAQIIKGTAPLVCEIERLQDILLAALTIYPCHMHEAQEICDEKLALMGLILIQQVGLPPTKMRHARHKQGTCGACDTNPPTGTEDDLAWAMAEAEEETPGPPPDYRDGNDISDEDAEDLDELPF